MAGTVSHGSTSEPIVNNRHLGKIKMEQTEPRDWKMGNEQIDGCMDCRTKEWIW